MSRSRYAQDNFDVDAYVNSVEEDIADLINSAVPDLSEDNSFDSAQDGHEHLYISSTSHVHGSHSDGGRLGSDIARKRASNTSAPSREYRPSNNSFGLDDPFDLKDGDLVDGDIQMSYEVKDEQNLESFEQNLMKLQIQQEDFRRNGRKCTEALREAEVLRTKVDELEDEYAQLQALIERLSLSKPEAGISRSLSRMESRVSKPIGASEMSALLSKEEEEEITLAEGLKQNSIFEGIAVYFIPFRKDIRRIEGRFGTAVASAFTFQQFTFSQNLLLAFFMVIFLLIHFSSTRKSIDGYSAVLMSEFGEEEAVTYTIFLMIGVFLYSFFAFTKFFADDKARKMTNAVFGKDELPYSKMILCAWDFGLESQVETETARGALTQSLLVSLNESRNKDAEKERSLMYYISKILGFTAWGGILVASVYGIFRLSVESQIIADALKGSFLSSLSSQIPAIAVALINASVPSLIGLISGLEAWDTGESELNANVIRLWISSLVNIVLQIASLLMLADPTFNSYTFLEPFGFPAELALRYKVASEVQPDSGWSCRLDQAGGTLILQVVTDSVMRITVFWFFGYIKKVQGWFTGEWVKCEYYLAEDSISSINSATILLIVFPYAPIVAVFAPFVWYAQFKLQKHFSILYYAKPKRDLRGSKSATLFVFLYVLSIIIVGWTNLAFFLFGTGFAKNCEIQDAGLGLCLSNTYSSATSTCDCDPNHALFKYFCSEESGLSSNCVAEGGYPKCICSKACGPFIDSETALTKIQGAFASNSVSSWFYQVRDHFLSRCIKICLL
jgi:hypothetical protein